MLDTQNSPPGKDKSSCNQHKYVLACAVMRRCTLMFVFVPFLRLCFSRRILEFTRESKFFSPRAASQKKKNVSLRWTTSAERQTESRLEVRYSRTVFTYFIYTEPNRPLHCRNCLLLFGERRRKRNKRSSWACFVFFFCFVWRTSRAMRIWSASTGIPCL